MILLFLQVKHIRAKYGEYFGITVAGYPGFFYFVIIFNFIIVTVFYLLFISATIICSYILLSFFSEAHPDMIGSDGLATPEGYQNELAYLKSKVISLIQNTASYIPSL